MTDKLKERDNINYSQVIGSLMGLIFIFVYLFLENDLYITLVLLGLQAAYIAFCYFFVNKKVGKLEKSKASFILYVLFLIPVLITSMRFSGWITLVVLLGALSALAAFYTFMNEYQMIMLFLMYHLFSGQSKSFYPIIFIGIYIFIIVLRAEPLVNKKKKDS